MPTNTPQGLVSIYDKTMLWVLLHLIFAGNYFGSHFIMGGERFDTPQPESYLFGENSDLNFLGSRPTPVSRIIK